jgi:pentatricopeptide repeat protein
MSEREWLKEADRLLRLGDYDQALRVYATVAESYERAGFYLKAVAVLKQMREIIKTSAPAQRDLDAKVRKSLIVTYRALGLLSDADALEREPS